MRDSNSEQLTWKTAAAELRRAYRARNDASFARAMARVRDLASRGTLSNGEAIVSGKGVGKDGRNERERAQSRISQEVREARLRLTHVMAVTTHSAKRTLDLIEKSAPRLEDSMRRVSLLLSEMTDFDDRDKGEKRGGQSGPSLKKQLARAYTDVLEVRRNLGEIVLAQRYQEMGKRLLQEVQDVVAKVEWERAEDIGSVSIAKRRQKGLAGVSGNTETAGHRFQGLAKRFAKNMRLSAFF